uniref:Cannabinoid receptor interacting protein 1a n=1 Tax=Neogobius melanostomus TaxID=47308 RepID=A0A8C6TA79_9GOBI
MEGDGVPPLLDISIALRLQPNDGPVFFKLLTGSKYRVEVVMKPGCVEATRDVGVGGNFFRDGVPLEEQSRDEASVVYQGKYDTEGVPHTKSGDRQPVQVSQFQKAGTFETREHCQFGNKFSSIDYECKPNETRTLMWVNKEAFN